jgi:hypothetical protein
MAIQFGNDVPGEEPSLGSETNYVAQLGRISGKSLQPNLIRHGVDLTFRNGPTDPDIFYIDVNNNRIGIKTSGPQTDLDVNSVMFVRDNSIVQGTEAVIDNLVFKTDGSVTTEPGPIEISPTGPDPYISLGRALTTDFDIKDNYIRSTVSNADIEMFPENPSAVVDLLSNTRIDGNLSVTGNITVDGDLTKYGNIYIGNDLFVADGVADDRVTFNADFSQDLLPGDDNQYDLGRSDKKWRTTWINGTLNTSNANITTVNISDQLRIQGNTISTLNSNDDITITSDTGNITVEELNFNDNVITNLDTTTPQQNPLRLISTGTGYVRFADTAAIRIPVGTSAERLGLVVGETRWNTDLGYLECFDGTVWQVATGGGIIITPAIQQELSEIYTLIFG